MIAKEEAEMLELVGNDDFYAPLLVLALHRFKQPQYHGNVVYLVNSCYEDLEGRFKSEENKDE